MSLIRNDLQFGDFVLECSARQLRRGADPITIPPKAFDLLLFLAENPGRPLLKDEILAKVWAGSIVEESNLTQTVFLLRKALAPDGSTIIKTLPGRGYQFSAQVSELAALDSAPTTLRSTTQTLVQTRVVYEEDTEERIPFWRSPLSLAVAVLVVALIAVAGWLGWQRWEDHVGGPPVQVVMADSEGGTGDAVLDRTLNSVLRLELAQSPFVTIVSANTVRRTMTQMRHKADDPLTVELARELCERTASQAVLHGSIAHAGNGYILVEEAVNCVDGAPLASARRQVARNDDLPVAIEKIAAQIRHGLGESRRTISRFDKPLVPQTTSSLEALRDYSQAAFVAQSGKFPEAIELLKQAVAIDPQFAAAYLDLATYSGNSLDRAGAQAWLKKAYEVRQFATEPARLFIVARYQGEIAGDLFESLRNYKAWIDIYPRSAQPWSGRTNVDMQLGQIADELVAARRTAELVPNIASVWQALANAQIHNGDFAGARATCEFSVSKNFDGETNRYLLLRIGHLTHDSALIGAQEAWGDQHPDSPILFANEAVYAQDEGRIADSVKLLQRMQDAFRRLGIPAAGDSARQAMAAGYFELGETGLARRILHETVLDPANFNSLLADAELDDAPAVATMLKDELAQNPQSTRWNLLYAPLIRGELAMLQGKPQEAITLMQPSRQLDEQGSDGYYLHGKAYMQAHMFPEAEAEFRYLLAHPGIEANAFQLPMSQLQLARVLSAEGRRDDAIAAYRTAVAQWSHADANWALGATVKQELAQLEASRDAR